MQKLFLILFIFFVQISNAISMEILPPYIFSTQLQACDPIINKGLQYKPTPVTALDLKKLPYRCDGNIKVYELSADEVFQLFHQGFQPGPVYTWGYNGSNPGPLIEAIEGETVRIEFKNNLPEPTTVHWHGIELPIGMDGASGVSQPPVKPGASFTYEFTLHQSGTYMYHTGHSIAKQLAMGLSGFFIVHSLEKPAIQVDKDYALFLQMWTVPPHSVILDTMDMMFNFFTINGKTAPSTSALKIKTGEKVRLRFGNISMMQHPIHLHGHTWKVVATGAGDNPPSTFIKGNTILVPVGQTMDTIIEKVDEPGNWLLHCHLPHHVTNNMEIDPVPGEPMNHGEAGMFTLFNVSRPGEEVKKPAHKMPHAMGPKVGIYTGNIKFENGVNFEVIFDLFKVQKENEWRKLNAHLKLFLDEQNLNYSYENVKYNFESGSLYLDEGERKLIIQDLKPKKMGGGHHASPPEGHGGGHSGMTHLEGTVISPYEGIKGKITLMLKANSNPSEPGDDEPGDDQPGDDEPGDDEPGHDMPMNNNHGMNHLMNPMPMPKASFTSSLEGSFKGTYKNKESLLQFYFLKGLGNKESKESNPFHTYLIKGQLGVKKGSIFRIEGELIHVSYNPFSKKLNFILKTGSLEKAFTCQVKQDQMNQYLDCPQFKFKRMLSSKGKNLFESKVLSKMAISMMTKNVMESKKVKQLDSKKVMEGEFKGHFIPRIKHSLINISFPTRLQINSKIHEPKPMRIPTPKVSASLHIYLGPKNSQPLSLNFPERAWLDSSSNATKNKNNLTFESHFPISLIIKEWRKNGIMGTLIHHHLGILGDLFLLKNSSLMMPHGVFAAKSLNGSFKLKGSNNEILKLNLLTLEDDVFEQNLLSPLFVKGILENKVTASKTSFDTGSFDPFSGELALISDEGIVIKGHFDPETGNLNINRSSLPKRRVRMREFKTKNYIRNK